ncbi:uncharacterized protein PAE49_023007 [Odontesthes bonariensis]|uniref:uncharacterized protein LOC142371458 n=1 Tax=Odontesthes bonariensis TaxID=219752 RepID=UPI003F58498F
MAQMMFQDSGQDGRSVLGMLAVQVERDPKTGATVVRSVAPISTPAGTPNATTIFDDGRKSIHTVGGSVGQPSTEELGQILSVIDGVGMKVLLDEVSVEPEKTEKVETSKYLEEKVLSLTAHDTMSKEDYIQQTSSGINPLEAEMRIEKCSLRAGDAGNETMMVVRDTAGKEHNIEGQRLEEDPVTLVFLGYTDDTTGDGLEDHESMPTVERVIITEDGEEHILEPEVSDSLQLPSAQEAEQQARKEPQDKAIINIPADGNGAGVKAEGEDGDKGKHKTCHCCSIM